MAWVPRGARDLRRAPGDRALRRDPGHGPPTAALLAARGGPRRGDPPLVVELRDLWAGNPLFDRRGGLLGALERWVFARAAAIVTVSPEAADDVRRRHPALAARVVDVPNGFEDELLGRREPRASTASRIEILHSGTLTADRPLAPLLRVLARDPYREAFRLVVHGYVAPPIAAQLAAADRRVDGRGRRRRRAGRTRWRGSPPPTSALVTQAASAGDATAVAGKVYEYLALGRPVLCLSAGGATEALLAAPGRRPPLRPPRRRGVDRARRSTACARRRAPPVARRAPRALRAQRHRAADGGGSRQVASRSL